MNWVVLRFQVSKQKYLLFYIESKKFVSCRLRETRSLTEKGNDRDGAQPWVP